MPTKYQPGMRVSEYLLSECVGAGAFCEVWRARHHVWENEEVAVKLPIEPEYVRYLRREGAVVHGLRHPNIIRVIGIDPYAETPYLTMELVSGPSLKRVISEHSKGVGGVVAATILRGVLSALRVAHEAGVLHRDIKPGNIMLHLEGLPLERLSVDRVKIGDFGLGYGETDALRSIAQSASINRDDALVGTLAYMAPELRDGTHKADGRTDLYSVGVVLFELLTGERPAGAELPSTIRPGIPEYLDGMFARLYARRDRRFETARAALEVLMNTDAVRELPAIPVREGRPVAKGPTQCPGCRASVSAGDQFCIQCGAQLAANPRRCEKCHAYPAADDHFCIFCGAALKAAVA